MTKQGVQHMRGFLRGGGEAFRRAFIPGWSRIHGSRSLTLYNPILAPFSLVYGLGVMCRLWAYRLGLFGRRRLPGFVVSVGNLTTGGTGKTPAVIMLAKWAQAEGKKVAVLSRGFGGRYRDQVLAVSDGNRVLADPRAAGDEPCLLAEKLPGIPVVLSRKRYRAGLFAHHRFGSDFFILDDGFQHLELKSDLAFVLLDVDRPFGNGHLLPWGPLREPIGQLHRADALILTRFNFSPSGHAALRHMKEKFPEIPVFCAGHFPERIVFPHTGQDKAPAFLEGKRVLAFAGIARPERFGETLRALGAEVAFFKAFRDHHVYKREEVQTLIQMKEAYRAQYVVTTEKDWVKVGALNETYGEIGYLNIRFGVVSDENRFFKIIQNGFRDRQTL